MCLAHVGHRVTCARCCQAIDSDASTTNWRLIGINTRLLLDLSITKTLSRNDLFAQVFVPGGLPFHRNCELLPQTFHLAFVIPLRVESGQSNEMFIDSKLRLML